MYARCGVSDARMLKSVDALTLCPIVRLRKAEHVLPVTQSYLWNTAASHRIERFGVSSVVAGDLVLLQQNSNGDAAGDAAGDGDGGGEGAAATGRSYDERSTDRLAAVHVVTAEEAAAGAYHCAMRSGLA